MLHRVPHTPHSLWPTHTHPPHTHTHTRTHAHTHHVRTSAAPHTPLTPFGLLAPPSHPHHTTLTSEDNADNPPHMLGAGQPFGELNSLLFTPPAQANHLVSHTACHSHLLLTTCICCVPCLPHMEAGQIIGRFHSLQFAPVAQLVSTGQLHASFTQKQAYTDLPGLQLYIVHTKFQMLTLTFFPSAAVDVTTSLCVGMRSLP